MDASEVRSTSARVSRLAHEASVAEATAFMSRHLGENIGVGDIADHLGYSPFHFSRVFSRTTRLSPGGFLTALRFHEAKRLLLGDDIPVVDACAAVGFTSLATFTRRFRGWVGVTPGALRPLADTVSERSPTPFALGDPRQPRVRVTLIGPDPGVRQPDLLWIGWYPRPSPIGLPAAGALRRGSGEIRLPLSPGNPWLLAFSVPKDADAAHHLAPRAPVVGGHPAPILHECDITLALAPAAAPSVPLLSALPALSSGV